MMEQDAKSDQTGFTLIEVMVAVTILSLLLFTIYGVFSSVSTTKQRLEADGEGYHQARVIFDRMGREIRSAYTNRQNPDTIFSGGINEDGNPFLTLSTTAWTPQGGGGTGISLVHYELRDDTEFPGQKVLIRNESPLFGKEDLEIRDYRLAVGIEAMTLAFYTDGQWTDQWLEGLPEMVQVGLAAKVNGREVPFVTTFEVPFLSSE